MPTLDKELRRTFESVVIAARQAAEAGAQKALESLAVHHHEPWGHLSPDDRSLRNRLRTHGRQLGDERDTKRGTQSIDKLVTECAYEHWHRMLFAKFLAEADLLIEPQTQVPLTLQDCEDLAHQSDSDWLSVATSFAQQMLPQIFRSGNPVLELRMPPESRARMEELLNSLPEPVFQADDSIGWAYQFWQSEKKDEINKSETKIGANEISAVTQLFTEHYMVEFLLDNSIGAWWASKVLSSTALETAETEQELRDNLALPTVSFDYLRFTKTPSGTWQIQDFTSVWPDSLAGLKLIDPCCGSGHFLVGAFLKLVPLRMHTEQLSPADACALVLSQNLHGLEIDQRCVELAAFALAYAAWRFPNAGGYRKLPELNLACSGLSVAASKQDWKEFAAGLENKRLALDWMHDAFKDSPVLGSLLDPSKMSASKVIEWKELSRSIEQALLLETSADATEEGVAAKGLAKAASLLSQRYHLVATNVPYLGRAKQADTLRQFCELHHDDAKHDLCTVFLERCIELCEPGAQVALVILQNWLFLHTYRRFREKLFRNCTWDIVARLGAGAFETISGEVVQVALISMRRIPTRALLAALTDDAVSPHFISVIDASAVRKPAEKAILLRTADVSQVDQEAQSKNPDARFVMGTVEHGTLLSEYADSYLGLGTCDAPHYFRYWWEVSLDNGQWTFIQTPPDSSNPSGGRESVVAWDTTTRRVKGMTSAERRQGHNKDYRGSSAWGKEGVSIAMMRSLRPTPYYGNLFNELIAVLIPKRAELLPALTAYCASPEFEANVRKIDQKVLVTNGTFSKVPFDEQRWQQEALKLYPNGLPKPYSEDPTQWIFHGALSRCKSPLQVAFARLLGFKWPTHVCTDMILADEALALSDSTKHLDYLADEDGIVCLNSLHGEPAAADRMLSFLATACGENWSASLLQQFLAEVGFKDKSLSEWLRDGFFSQHCDEFHHPFIWHIWDGQLDGFHAFINYHNLAAPNGGGQHTLQKLIYTYLGDWIDRQRADQKAGVDGADARLAAAENLKNILEQILIGEPPFDLFVRWKPLSQQAIGWAPDVNDGIRINIRPFMSARLEKTRNAPGILRTTPRLISWSKDRGKDPQDDRSIGEFPWAYGWDQKLSDFAGTSSYDGNRWNDLHYTNAFKLAARRAASPNPAEVTV